MLDMLWPIGARTDENGELWLGGCAVSELTRTFGTPLYIFDETTLRTRARSYQEALRRHYPASAQAAYASKAYLCLAIAQLFEEEGLDLDVVSGGELHVALQAGFPAERIHFHGNNKSPAELAQALECWHRANRRGQFLRAGAETLAGMVIRVQLPASCLDLAAACRRACRRTPTRTSRPARWTPSSGSTSNQATPSALSWQPCRRQDCRWSACTRTLARRSTRRRTTR